MAETATRIAIGERLWRIALALLPALALVLLRGVDTNWDLRNYHLYDPHAWWTGRMAIDIAPAQLQTWHNPLLDLPLYLIVQSGWDLRWASAWLTLPFAIAIYLLLGLQAISELIKRIGFLMGLAPDCLAIGGHDDTQDHVPAALGDTPTNNAAGESKE